MPPPVSSSKTPTETVESKRCVSVITGYFLTLG